MTDLEWYDSLSEIRKLIVIDTLEKYKQLGLSEEVALARIRALVEKLPK